MTTLSTILAWEMGWTKQPGGLGGDEDDTIGNNNS